MSEQTQPPVAVASSEGLGPLQPAAWMEPGKYWTLEHELWMAHHRKSTDPNVQATLAAKTKPLYALTDDEVRILNKARSDAAWRARRLDLCKCDRIEYCRHCWPPEFREGGVWREVYE